MRKATQALDCCRRLRNWPAVLGRIGLSHLGWNRGAFTATTRGGVTVQAPNLVGSRDPVIEVLASDAYHLESLVWSDPIARRHVLDVGTQVGAFSCALAARLPGATFTCVEPSASARAWLAGNLARNGVTARCEILPVALVEQDGPVEFWDPGNASAQAALWPGSGPGYPTTVQGRTFLSVVTSLGRRPNVVKLDCEGGEYAAILRAPEAAWESVQQIFLEYHPVPEHRSPELFQRLRQLGFQLVWRDDDQRVPDLGMAYLTRVESP